MKTLLFIAIAIISLAVIMGCAGSKKTTLDNSIPQQVLLGYNFINHAWGYQNNGKFLGRDGNLKKFKVDKANKGKWVVPEEGEISKAALEANYARATETLSTLSAEETTKAYTLIKQLSRSELKYSTTKMNRNDYGGHDFYAYLLDEATNTYKAILLKRSNDKVEKIIKNPEGLVLLEMLGRKPVK